jgi:hypothetical protein
MDPEHQTTIPQPPFTKAGLAGVLGFAAMWCVTYPLYSMGYVSKNWGTLIDIAGFAIPFAYFKSRQGKRRPDDSKGTGSKRGQ